MRARPARLTRLIAARSEATPKVVGDWFEAQVNTRSKALLAITAESQWSYEEFDALANRIAHAALASGARPGSAVALMLNNSIDMLASIIAMAKIGLPICLINPEQRGPGLAHAITSVPTSLIIAEPEVAGALEKCGAPLPQLVLHSETGFAQWLKDQPTARPDPALRSHVQPADPIFYIFTSGTTGLPKAALCSNARYISGSISEAVLLEMDTTDRAYTFLPMFHIAALSIIGAAIAAGGSFFLRPRFSVSRFWDDIRTYRLTAMQYLGETVRYVAAQPPRPDDKDHTLRAMMGGGIQPAVWRAFRDRFGVSNIVECYGSSEGVCALINFEGRIGSAGRPMPDDTTMRLVRLAEDGRTLARDADGMFIECATDETGELIGLLSPERVFEGYSSPEAERDRLSSDGDGSPWFRSGDMFRRDADGFFYFMDRIGDTYRWKGENISTQQVAQAIMALPDVARAVVYGVPVPGAEGRAGMALIEPADVGSFDPSTLADRLAATLAPAAMPLFLRIGSAGELTATYKVRLETLRENAYDPRATDDPLHVLDRETGTYLPLTPQSLERNGLAVCERHAG